MLSQLGCSTTLEEEDGDLTEIEVDEVLGLVGDVGTEVSTNDTMPGGVVLLVELFLEKAAISFSMLNFSRAWVEISIASCCISSDISAFLTTAFLSAILK